jgi:Fe-Mn family superoxide dismutase
MDMRKMTFTIYIISAIMALAISVKAQVPFELPKLTYEYNALEPHIDAQTMLIHHTKHHKGYIDNLNKAIEGTNARILSIEEIIKNISNYSLAVRNNAGGHFNHTLFWLMLSPKTNTKPSKPLNDAIVKQFGSIDNFITQFNQTALKQFGSGWAWLSLDSENKLFISSTPNQDNPLMDISEQRGIPILGIDVWEHAYYLNYQNRRGDYLLSVWKIINWEEISRRYESIVK